MNLVLRVFHRQHEKQEEESPLLSECELEEMLRERRRIELLAAQQRNRLLELERRVES